MNDFNNLKLRSVTYTIDLEKITLLRYKNRVKSDISEIQKEFKNKGIFVRTIRFNTLKISPKNQLDQFLFLNKVKVLSTFSKELGVRWFNIAFDLTRLDRKHIIQICRIGFEIIKRHPNSFVNLIVADKYRLNPFAAYMSSKLILEVSNLSFNGFDNFRVGVSLNPSNNTPFFPFSYSEKDQSFSLAVEITDYITKLLDENVSNILNLNKIERIVFDRVSPMVVKIDSISRNLSKKLKINYGGQDLSLAPFPDENISVVKILHQLGVDDIGANSTLFLTAYLTQIVKSLTSKTNSKAAGFNGVMYSMLEDHLMCNSNDKKLLTIDQIISYSTLCGCGLDMVPIPGNILVEELASIILDVGTIASRLDKPLGVRVLPIPNKDSNEFTEFDMDFLTNTRIMKMKNLTYSFQFLNKTSFEFYEN